MRPHPERAPAGIRCARSVLCPVMLCPVMLCPADIVRGVDSVRTGEGRRTPPPPLDKTRSKTRPAAALEGWYPRKYAYCTIYRK